MARLAVLTLALLLLAAPVLADDATMEPEVDVTDHGEEDKDSPGLGLIGLAGAVAVAGFMRRK